MIVDALPLSRAAVDRAAEHRPDGLAHALAEPSTRVLLVDDGSVLTDEAFDLLLLSPDEARALVADPVASHVDERAEHTVSPDGRVAGGLSSDAAAVPTASPEGTDTDGLWLLLGRDADGTAYAARRVLGRRPAPATGSASDVLVHAAAGAPDSADPPPTPLPPGARWSSLRVVGATLSARDAGLATSAVALDAWHARHPRCPRCGAATVATQAGWVRACTVDGSEHYPRTDPAVIMAVVDDADRLLLGHATAWAAHRWSTLAGFVEAGESLESAVRREVREETGVVVDTVEYRGSQPWPFPASLMVGFRAHARSTDVAVDGVELESARWFTRAELRDAVAAGDVIPPGPSSIARALVEDWYGGRLPAGPEV
ncbi:NAD(+) diphosphatase [Cellulomonas sp. H30R-01]|uniref:NAD(+) diphosphatase n=1 Tax=Cellulomonas sp. H30R-01 TaxID=2704467 RepID=UPI00138D4AA2|nr:NAD(+) diphosphatase [Cellulomonas sp. H30R-01]QHT56462.1 NAD(+) diphosphatase [Cellulomonas sp. H30R-01]